MRPAKKSKRKGARAAPFRLGMCICGMAHIQQIDDQPDWLCA